MAITLARLNTCPAEEFIRLAGPVFERSPWIAGLVADLRPFDSLATLHLAMCEVVRGSGLEKQLALIRAHPDLVGRAVLTAESNREQAAAGLMQLTAEQAAAFGRYNAEYRARFGFPFIICARQNKQEAILRAFPERLAHTREVEIEIALEQIFQIASLRLADLLS